MRTLFATAAAAVLVSGCATITRGTAQDFTVESTPPGASVSTSNGFECPSTPCTFRMPRKEGFTVNLTMDGYEPAEAAVTSGMSGGGAAGMAGNVLIGGLIGVGVDATSGALNDLSPNPLRVELRPLAPAEPAVVAEPAAPAEAIASAEGSEGGGSPTPTAPAPAQ